MASSLPKEWKELEQHLKQPPNMLLNADVIKIWKDLKKCVLASDGEQVERVFGKLEQEIEKLFKYAIQTKKGNYSRLKDSIVATCNANKTDMDTGKLAPANEIAGIHRRVIQVKGGAQTNASNQGNNSTSLLADRLCDLIQWLHDCITEVTIMTTPPKREEDKRLSEKHTVTYSDALAKTIEIKDIMSKVTQKVTEKQVLSTDATVAVQADSRAIKRETSSSPNTGDHGNSATNHEQLGQGETIQKLREELREQRISFEEKQQKLEEDKDELNRRLSKMTAGKPLGQEQAQHEDTIRTLQEELRVQRMSFEQKQQKFKEDLYRLQQDKDQLMTRMSKMAGDKLTHNNPGIADLSDPNRPQKLAEEFGELYDNEWTDAIEKLNPKHKVERESIDVLASILKFCYTGSERIADIQLSYIEAACFSLKPPDREKVKPKDVSESAKRHLLDAQYGASAVNMKAAIEMVTADLKRQKGLKETTQKIPKFTDKCIEICWSMVTHTPRMIFLWPDSKDRKIDMDMFQFYTKSGDTLDFVVWPAMLSCRNGPLLKKGTVQPVPVTK